MCLAKHAVVLYGILSRTASLDRLRQAMAQDFLLLTEGRVRSQACLRAIRILQADEDVAAVVSSGGSAAWDVGPGVEVDALFCRTAHLRALLEAGFEPVVDWGELDSALRHAGWRVRNLPELLADPPPRHHFQSGRRRLARQLYDSGVEQLLAQGPRLAKRLFLYDLWMAGRRYLQQGSPLWYELGYCSQAVSSAFGRDRQRLLDSPWRRGRLGFQFPASDPTTDTAVILFTANRPWYLRRALRALHKHWPTEKPPVLVLSQDGGETTTTSLIRSLGGAVHHRQFNQQVGVPLKALVKGFAPYFRIAAHFGSSISWTFDLGPQIRRVIVLEDDIEIGPDFFPFLERFAPELDRHSDLLAVSAWNDHGRYAECPATVHRTDCFPGLGWMITRDGWSSLVGEWPEAFWDEWLRRAEVLKGRQFLRPEVSRVRNFGRSGTGSSDFFDRYLAPQRWQDAPYEPESSPSKLGRAEYEASLFEKIRQARVLQHPNQVGDKDGVIVYHDRREFQRLAGVLDIVPNYHQSGPRAAFDGIVILKIRGVRLFLIRGDTWSRLSHQRALKD